MPDTYEQLAASVLVAHQRRDIGSCLCGWSEFGRSHAAHVASVLADAGALQTVPAQRAEAQKRPPRCGYVPPKNPNPPPGPPAPPVLPCVLLPDHEGAHNHWPFWA